MTKQEIITLIENAIKTNGTNDITADVLRPVLIAMSSQINDALGSLLNLDTTTKENIVSALNEILSAPSSGGITILTGTANPNTTSPPLVNLGDFYNQTFNGATSNFYIFNGIDWILLSESQNSSSVHYGVLQEYSQSPVIIGTYISTVIYVGNSENAIIQLPNPLMDQQREITIVNQSPFIINTSPPYRALSGDDSNILIRSRSVTLKTNFSKWIQIK
jgi:hypothetical protein